MKIVIVTPAFPLQNNSVLGGLEGVCYYLTQSLSKMNDVELLVVLTNAQLYKLDRTVVMTINGVRLIALVAEGNKPFYFKILIQMPKLLKRLLFSLDCDIIHFQGAATLVRCTNQPNVLTVHGINERDTLFRGHPIIARFRSWALAMTEGRARRKAPNVIAINPYVHPFLKFETKQRVWDIPNPVADMFFDIKRDPQKGRVFSAATITKRKNQSGLIKAFASSFGDYPYAVLRLAGSGADSSYGMHCREIARSLGVADRVHFLGGIGIDRMMEELGMAHCMALTSYQETAPLSISEAMAAGVPVVASNCCGIPWMVEEGITGRLVDPGSIDDIARALRQVVLEDDAIAMGMAAKRIAESRYRASMVARQTVEVYRKILITS